MILERKYPELEFDLINWNEVSDIDFHKEIERNKIQINNFNKLLHKSISDLSS
ncbi:MAG: hypothetical protein NZM09_04215 [Ignavibacterium sp.]|nr:hypothetical protein [Ignavibacterium sp.]MDW8374882.1 hypothetical protein [Ignavibacteriales bacterium]